MFTLSESRKCSISSTSVAKPSRLLITRADFGRLKSCRSSGTEAQKAFGCAAEANVDDWDLKVKVEIDAKLGPDMSVSRRLASTKKAQFLVVKLF
jgi:hypothetical protein